MVSNIFKRTWTRDVHANNVVRKAFIGEPRGGGNQEEGGTKVLNDSAFGPITPFLWYFYL